MSPGQKLNKNYDQKEIQQKLFKTNVRISQAMQSIKRVTDGRNFHQEFSENKPITIELLPEVPIYCKVLCKERIMPAAIKFEYKGKGNMNVYVCSKHPEPTFSECEMRASGRPTRIIYQVKDAIGVEPAKTQPGDL